MAIRRSKYVKDKQPHSLDGRDRLFHHFFFNVHDRLFDDYHCESLESLEWQRQTIEANKLLQAKNSNTMNLGFFTFSWYQS